MSDKPKFTYVKKDKKVIKNEEQKEQERENIRKQKLAENNEKSKQKFDELLQNNGEDEEYQNDEEEEIVVQQVEEEQATQEGTDEKQNRQWTITNQNMEKQDVESIIKQEQSMVEVATTPEKKQWGHKPKETNVNPFQNLAEKEPKESPGKKAKFVKVDITELGQNKELEEQKKLEDLEKRGLLEYQGQSHERTQQEGHERRRNYDNQDGSGFRQRSDWTQRGDREGGFPRRNYDRDSQDKKPDVDEDDSNWRDKSKHNMQRDDYKPNIKEGDKDWSSSIQNRFKEESNDDPWRRPNNNHLEKNITYENKYDRNKNDQADWSSRDKGPIDDGDWSRGDVQSVPMNNGNSTEENKGWKKPHIDRERGDHPNKNAWNRNRDQPLQQLDEDANWRNSEVPKVGPPDIKKDSDSNLISNPRKNSHDVITVSKDKKGENVQYKTTIKSNVVEKPKTWAQKKKEREENKNKND